MNSRFSVRLMPAAAIAWGRERAAVHGAAPALMSRSPTRVVASHPCGHRLARDQPSRGSATRAVTHPCGQRLRSATHHTVTHHFPVTAHGVSSPGLWATTATKARVFTLAWSPSLRGHAVTCPHDYPLTQSIPPMWSVTQTGHPHTVTHRWSPILGHPAGDPPNPCTATAHVTTNPCAVTIRRSVPM